MRRKEREDTTLLYKYLAVFFNTDCNTEAEYDMNSTSAISIIKENNLDEEVDQEEKKVEKPPPLIDPKR